MAELKITKATVEKVLRLADALEIAIDGLRSMADDLYCCHHDGEAKELLERMRATLGVTDEEPEGSGKETLRM